MLRDLVEVEKMFKNDTSQPRRVPLPDHARRMLRLCVRWTHRCVHGAHNAEGDEIHHGMGDVLLMVTVGDPGWAGCAMRSHRCGALLWPSSSSSLFFGSPLFPSYRKTIAYNYIRETRDGKSFARKRYRHWTFLESSVSIEPPVAQQWSL